MDAENLAITLWFAKLFQVISAIILTPEIIGPDRFDKLEKLIEAQDFSHKSEVIWRVIFVLGFFLTCPWTFLDASRIHANVSGEFWTPPVARWVAHIVFALNLFGLFTLGFSSDFAKLIQSVLAKLVIYLRRVSVFRTIAVTFAILLFFIGVGLELILEWPF